MTKLRCKTQAAPRAKSSCRSPRRPLSAFSSCSGVNATVIQPKPAMRSPPPARPTTRERLVQVLDLLRRQQQLLKAVLHQTPPSPGMAPLSAREGPVTPRPRSQKKPKAKLSLNLLLDEDQPPQRKRSRKIKNGVTSPIDGYY